MEVVDLSQPVPEEAKPYYKLADELKKELDKHAIENPGSGDLIKKHQTQNARGNNEKLKNQAKLLDDFSKKYLLTPDLRKMRAGLGEIYKSKTYQGRRNDWKTFVKRAMFDFYSENFYSTVNYFGPEDNPFNRMMEFKECKILQNFSPHYLSQNREEALKDLLSYPHSKLDAVFNCYKEFSYAPITSEIKQLYQKTSELYHKITEAKIDGNIEKWFEYLIESDDDRFIIQMIEFEIAEHPSNVIHWRLYIRWLKSKNKNAAFEVFHRYRRFFINDSTLDSEFANPLKKVPTAEHRYLNKMKFRKNNNFDLLWDPSSTTANSAALDQKFIPSPKNYIETQKHQNFALPITCINFIIQKAPPEILQKLYQTCEYFFLKNPKIICHGFHIINYIFVSRIKYKNQSILFNPNYMKLDEKLWKNKKFCISNSLNCANFGNNFLSQNIIPKLDDSSCHIKFLRLYQQFISNNDYNFLTRAGKIEKIAIQYGSIRNNKNGELISFENVMKNLPRASSIQLGLELQFTLNTGEELNALKRKNKINVLSFLMWSDILINTHELAEFLKKNMTPRKKSHVAIDYLHRDIDPEIKIGFETELIGYLQNISQQQFESFAMPEIHINSSLMKPFIIDEFI